MSKILQKTPLQHLLAIEDLSVADITALLDRAQFLQDQQLDYSRTNSPLHQRTVINMFFENSTRTRTSFELAAQKLGADVISMSGDKSSTKKGETLLDTALTLNAMKPAILVVRHSDSGAAHLLASKVKCGVINAGDGLHEHPTQALLDALTIRRNKGKIAGLKVAICGDILHSRVARSNIFLLTKMGAEVRVIAPPTLMPAFIEQLGVKIFYTLTEGIQDVDVVLMLRLQLERMNGQYFPSLKEFFHFYGLDRQKLQLAKPDAIVMHPGPINRGVEIDSEIADDINQSVITQQVELGVAVRMACLESLALYTPPVIVPKKGSLLK
jgi:aspartate carbamoyltransferase catalytic subunit